VSEEELSRVVSEVIEEGGELMPTLVEQWLERGRQEGLAKGLEQGLEQGREEGLEQGREEGLEQGRWEAALIMLRRFLIHRFEAIPEPLDEALRDLDIAALNELSEVAFEAESLTEIEVALSKLKPGSKPQTSGANGN
jgi:flagellar biosynthesis/type III secretory pathway protein FliH